MKSLGKLVVGVGALALALLVTGPKLYRMAQIRDFVPGAEISDEVVAEKWHQTVDRHFKGGDTYWLTWSRTDIETPGNHRLDLPEAVWYSINVGDPIEIVHVGDDPKPYHRDGSYASNAHLVFDLLLLGTWLFLAVSNLPSLRR